MTPIIVFLFNILHVHLNFGEENSNHELQSDVWMRARRAFL